MEDSEHPDAPSPKRRRASRAGAAKRFECQHPGCEKRYSRAEHLHRHELNHNPKAIYRCEEPDCGHTFVRPDLYARHKHKHEELASGAPRGPGTVESDIMASETPRQEEAESTWTQVNTNHSNHARSVSTPSISTASRNNWSGDAPPLLTPDSTLLPVDATSSSGLSATLAPPLASPNAAPPIHAWNSTDDTSAQANDNFAAWLFESPGSQHNDFNLTNMPFLDFGLEYSPKDVWNLEEFTFNTDPGTGTDSHATPASQKDSVSAKAKPRANAIPEQTRVDIVGHLSYYLMKQRNQRPAIQDSDHILYSPDAHALPNITIGVLEKLMENYWTNVDKQMLIVHQPTFSAKSTNVLLILAIIMLGAADMVKQKPKGHLRDYGELADLIATQLRWEIFTDGDAQPPVQLWVAQALLLLEFYEKQWSSRKLHERAHIHHASTLTLLRRGSPLVGRSESESPVSGMPTRCATPNPDDHPGKHHSTTAFDSWWIHWVRNESFNRVVFTAFQMDTLHALMYGHAADMAPYEIRLPLPCDDSLWRAKSAEEVHRLDANLKMYGIRPINFLDGLKRCLHAHDVQTHAPARMLLMAGLLSVGWHISRREKHLQFLETVPSMREQGRWRSLLLHAFGHWRQSFDDAVGARKAAAGTGDSSRTDASAPTVLYHLAHMTMHADIIDIQIFSGTKRLLGRRVSEKDYFNTIQRMKSWACTPVARHAVLHAFKLLHEVLVSKPRKLPAVGGGNNEVPHTPSINYTCRNDTMFYRPWSVYLASLIVWAYQRASSLHISGTFMQHGAFEVQGQQQDDRQLCCRYLGACAAVDDAARLLPMLSETGCAAILSVVSKDFADAEPELVIEASRRLQSCRDMMVTSTAGRMQM